MQETALLRMLTEEDKSADYYMRKEHLSDDGPDCSPEKRVIWLAAYAARKYGA